MSIENTLERIAAALEKLAAKESPIIAESVTLNSPIVEDQPSFQGVIEETAAVPADADVPQDGEALKKLAQELAGKMGDKIPAFTAWVRDTLCKKFGVSKVRDIPLEKIAEATRDIRSVAKSYGVEA